MPDRDWMIGAACRDHPNPDLFFPSANGRQSNRQMEEAARICVDCPVIVECSQYRADTGSAFGVWAGSIIRTQTYGSTGPPTMLHGTEAMYKRHRRRGETPCASCRVAAQRAQRARKSRESA